MTTERLNVGGVGADARAGAATDGAPSPEDSTLEALRAMAADERVRAAEAAVRETCSELRWNEALRRRWHEAHVKAVIRGAIVSDGVEGTMVSAEVLREQVVAGPLTQTATGDPGLDAMAGLWCAGTRLIGWMSDLVGRGRSVVPPACSLLAVLYRDVVGPPAAGGRAGLGGVGVPRAGQMLAREGSPGSTPQGEELAARLAGLVDLTEAPQTPAPMRATIVYAEMLAARPFTAGSAAVGCLLVRHPLMRDGLEPTGTAATDPYPGWVPVAYAEAAGVYASGAMDGAVAWVVWQAEAVPAGVREAQRLCWAVQAGTWRAG